MELVTVILNNNISSPIMTYTLVAKRGRQPYRLGLKRHGDRVTVPISEVIAQPMNAEGRPMYLATCLKEYRVENGRLISPCAQEEDDFSLIPGVGSKSNKKIHAGGMRTFEDAKAAGRDGIADAVKSQVVANRVWKWVTTNEPDKPAD